MRQAMGNLVLWGLAAAALLAAGNSPAAEEAQQVRPNIIIYLSDDHGVDFVGCYGNTAVHTPNIDELARQGMRLTRFFAASPTCTPSRSSLYTGLYPARHGAMGNHSNCRPGLKSLPSYLKALGYRVALADKGDVRPPAVFDFEIVPKAVLPPRPDLKRVYRGEGLNTKVVDEFLARHVSEHRGEPLCLVLGDNGPHVVWEPNHTYDPAKLPLPPIMVDTPKTRAGLANYYQDITTTDQRLGEVLASLKKHGLEENTLLIYTTDQGPEWPHCKWTVYDTGLRVPFLVRWPGKIKRGTVCDALISAVDLTPTLIDVAGGRAPADLDGRSFKEVLLAKAANFRDMIFASHTGDRDMNVFPQRCARGPRYKYVLNLLPQNTWTTHFTKVMDIPGSHGDIYHTWVEKAKTDPRAARLVDTLEHHPAEELYDTQADPWELNNVAAKPELQAVLEKLRAELQRWMAAQGDPGTDG